MYHALIALGFWIKVDGSKEGNGVLLYINSYEYKEILLLIKLLQEKYNNANILVFILI